MKNNIYTILIITFANISFRQDITLRLPNTNLTIISVPKFIFLLFILLFHLSLLHSQNRAPSLYLNYQDHYSGDIIINTIKVKSPSPLYTYYCGLLWNSGQDAGGYCGIQEHPNGKNFIFSLWDPVSVNAPITHDYAHPSTDISPFGGEGTGLRSLNFGIQWQEENWITLLSRSWSEPNNPNVTYFGYWIKKSANNRWYHIVTMKYPVGGLSFNTSTSSFIEDWLGNGQENRKVYHKLGWKRNAVTKVWKHFDETYFDRVFPDAGTVNYIENYDGGVANNTFFMSSGGTISPTTNTDDTYLNVNTESNISGFTPGVLTNTQISQVQANLFNISWAVSDQKLPQFKVRIEIFDHNANNIANINQLKPHIKSVTVNTSNFPTGTYFYKISLTDIFDNVFTSQLKPFDESDCLPSIVLSNNIPSGLYEASDHVQALGIINSNSNVTMTGGNYIEWKTGFDGRQGSVVVGEVSPCTN